MQVGRWRLAAGTQLPRGGKPGRYQLGLWGPRTRKGPGLRWTVWVVLGLGEHRDP